MSAGPATPPGPAASADGRDRLVVHLVWEGVLALITVVLVIVAILQLHNFVQGVLLQAAIVGPAASGFALSVRTGTPNLAVGSAAGFTGVLSFTFITGHGWSTPVAMTTAAVLVVALGAVVGLLVVALSVPAWAATLGVGFVLDAASLALTGDRPAIVNLHAADPAALWFGVFVLVSLVGGAAWWLPGLRERLSVSRHAGEPGRWAGMRPALGAVVGIAGSNLLAALAGIVALRFSFDSVTTGRSLTVVALAAALLGGVSVFGRRAGVTGTVLGVLIVVIMQSLLVLHGVPFWLNGLLIALVALLGLVVSRGIESLTAGLNARPRLARPPAPPVAPPPVRG